MIESCIDADPTADDPKCERPITSFRCTKGMKPRPAPPISAGWPSAHRP